MQNDAGRSRAVVGLTLLATPAAFGTEQLLARFLLPPDLEIVRNHFAEALLPVGWVLIALTVTAGIYAVMAFARLDPRSVSGAASDRKRLRRFLLFASIPQLPALVATVGALLGISMLHAIAAVAISTGAVATLGWHARPGAPAPGEHDSQP